MCHLKSNRMYCRKIFTDCIKLVYWTLKSESVGTKCKHFEKSLYMLSCVWTEFVVIWNEIHNIYNHIRIISSFSFYLVRSFIFFFFFSWRNIFVIYEAMSINRNILYYWCMFCNDWSEVNLNKNRWGYLCFHLSRLVSVANQAHTEIP